MITLQQIRKTEDKAKVNRLSNAYLLNQDDRQTYITWLNRKVDQVNHNLKEG
jgi:hypothetical protein